MEIHIEEQAGKFYYRLSGRASKRGYAAAIDAWRAGEAERSKQQAKYLAVASTSRQYLAAAITRCEFKILGKERYCWYFLVGQRDIESVFYYETSPSGSPPDAYVRYPKVDFRRPEPGLADSL